MAQENLLRAVVDFGDQPVSIPLYVENCESADRIGRGEHAFDVRQTPPFRFLGYPVPEIQRAGEIAVPFGRLQQLFSADNVHGLGLLLNSQNANMSMENFADCEVKWRVQHRPVMWLCCDGSGNKKGSDCSEPFEFNPGGDLRSRAVTRAVSSAQQGLTSVFGMGTGVTLAIRPPGNWKSKLGSRKLARSFDEQLREVG